MKPKTKKGKKDGKRGKGKATNKRVENVVFDLSARNEFVTGKKETLEQRQNRSNQETLEQRQRQTILKIDHTWYLS